MNEARISLYGVQGETFIFSALDTLRRVPNGDQSLFFSATAAGDSTIEPLILDFGHIRAEPVTLGMAIFDDVALEFDALLMMPEESMSGLVVGVPGNSPVPRLPLLRPSYSNPFRASTSIVFELPAPGDVLLAVYDVQGRLVRTLLRGHRAEGIHTVVWDGRSDRGHPVASGIFFYHLRGAGHSDSRSVVRVR